MNNIKAICFDLDGVYFTPTGKQSFHNALHEEFGASRDAVDTFMHGSEVMNQLVRGQITPTDFWQRLREQTQITATDAALVTRWIRDYEVDEQVRATVLQARERGYKTCVCTNNNAARLPALEEKFGFMSDFDVIISSHEVGHTKPSTEIFTALLEQVAVAPAELVYSDDNPDRIQGAQDLGIITFVYEDFDQFLKKLSALGVQL